MPLSLWPTDRSDRTNPHFLCNLAPRASVCILSIWLSSLPGSDVWFQCYIRERCVYYLTKSSEQPYQADLIITPQYVAEKAETQGIIKYMSMFTQALSDEAISKPRAIWCQGLCISQEVPLGNSRKQASHGMPWNCVGSRGRHSHRTQCKWCPLASCKTEG